jgi:hypothetical protein
MNNIISIPVCQLLHDHSMLEQEPELLQRNPQTQTVKDLLVMCLHCEAVKMMPEIALVFGLVHQVQM